MLLNRWETTLRKPITFSGKGLHSGRVVSLQVKPAPAGSGIVFTRTDVDMIRPIPAKARNVLSTNLSTTIGDEYVSISTIEHLMAAFAGLGISNASVTVDAPEIPIMDGSSLDFVRGFLKVGVVDLAQKARAYRLKKSFELREGDKSLVIEPSHSQRITCSIEFRNQVIGNQSVSYSESLESFLAIADARTFCHFSDVQAMRERGLALGGGLDNAIVVTDQGVMNDSGLRSHDEFVRHKLLDLIGDFAVLGLPLLAEIRAHKTGHGLHAQAINLLLSRKDEYLEEFFPEDELFGFGPALQDLVISANAFHA